MTSLISRRSLIRGLGTAPVIIASHKLMKVKSLAPPADDEIVLVFAGQSNVYDYGASLSLGGRGLVFRTLVDGKWHDAEATQVRSDGKTFRVTFPKRLIA